MRKTAVVYWSGTGNTQMMAEKVAEGVRAAGAEADVYNCTEFSADLMSLFGVKWSGTRTTLSLSNTLSAICLKIGNAIGPVISFAMTTSNFASIN